MKTATKCAGALVGLFLAAGVVGAAAESSVEVRRLEGRASPLASLDAISWMEGRWVSDGDEKIGPTERIVLGPKNRNMHGIVRVLQSDGSQRAFELTTIADVGGTLEYRFSQVHPDLSNSVGVDFQHLRLVAIEGDAAYFEGVTFVRRGADRMTMALEGLSMDASTATREIHYRKVPF